MYDTENGLIYDGETLLSARSRFGYPIAIWDEGFGPLWVYRESLGVMGVVRASTWEEAYECVVDEIMLDADPEDPSTYARDYDEDAEEGELAEGVHYRSSGVPSNPNRTSYLAAEDLNGSALDLLTPELLSALEIAVEIEPCS